MALFEEFIRDPLISEKLMNPEQVSLDSSIQKESIFATTRELFTESPTDTKLIPS